MTNHTQVKKLINWIETFDHSLLHNEDDVETKFVLPLFRLLNYPERCRRGKYPIKAYKPGTPGRKSEIDQIYFATTEEAEQTADTALLLVEAKEPQKASLDDDVPQARFYSSHLKPLFYLVTNGYQMKVFKRHSFREDELVFDICVYDLAVKATAMLFYNQLNFPTTKSLKHALSDEYSHSQYVLLENSLRRYPDLQAILSKGDFTPQSDTFIDESGYSARLRRVIVKSKVAIECELPYAFQSGKCRIEFSNLTLRGLAIYLDHQDILGNLLIGLHTPPELNARSFVRMIAPNFYEVRLGQAAMTIQQQEAEELCECVDEVFGEYKRLILDSERALEAQAYDVSDSDDIFGFTLFYVKRELWDLIHRFSLDHDYAKGTSEWHIFDAAGMSIQVGRKTRNANILGRAVINEILLASDYVEVIHWIDPVTDLESQAGDIESWKNKIGKQGIWSAKYTKNWLLHDFIPHVIFYYEGLDKVDYSYTITRPILNDEDDKIIGLTHVDDFTGLGPYIHYVIEWLIIQGSSFPTQLVRPYYYVILDLAKDANPKKLDTNYILGKLYTREHEKRKRPQQVSPIDEMYMLLEENVQRVKTAAFESAKYVDDMSRTLLSLRDRGTVSPTQDQFNKAKQSLLNLWELARFEKRYVFPNRTR